MISRAITVDEVRLGDQIALYRDGVVSGWDKGGLPGGHYFTFAGPCEHIPAWYGGMKITLLNRPLPPLPTEDGTVVGDSDRRVVLVRRDTAWWYGDSIWQNDEAGPLDPNEWVLLGEIRP